VKRAAEILAALQTEFQMEPGHTTSDGKLSLATARCLGSCGLAPAVVLDGSVSGLENPETILLRVRELIAGAKHEPLNDAAEVLELEEKEIP
jgi:bidirectional [NiFe] hydrogenase diaphorase subunit